jgi:hypothetical protein
MTNGELSERAARRRGELHPADGDRHVALAIEAQRHLIAPGSGRAGTRGPSRHSMYLGRTESPAHVAALKVSEISD